MMKLTYTSLSLCLLLSSCGEPQDVPSICECMQQSKQIALQMSETQSSDELDKLNAQKAALDKKCEISLKAFEGSPAERAKASEEMLNCKL